MDLSGPSLLEHLDKMPMVDRKINAPLMMPVSEKYKDMGTIVVGASNSLPHIMLFARISPHILQLNF